MAGWLGLAGWRRAALAGWLAGLGGWLAELAGWLAGLAHFLPWLGWLAASLGGMAGCLPYLAAWAACCCLANSIMKMIVNCQCVFPVTANNFAPLCNTPYSKRSCLNPQRYIHAKLTQCVFCIVATKPKTKNQPHAHIHIFWAADMFSLSAEQQ